MSCAEYKTDIIEAARGGDASVIQAHLDRCYSCRALFEEQCALSEAMRVLPEEPAPLALEGSLVREFQATWPAKRSGARWWWIPVAAAAAILGGLLLYPKPKPVPVTAVAKPVEQPKTALASAALPGGSEVVTQRPVVRKPRRTREAADPPPFISIPYTTPLAPYERAQVMQVEMPVAELIAAGLPIATSDPGAQARADVIVGDDGRARAVRVLSIFERSFEQ